MMAGHAIEAALPAAKGSGPAAASGAGQKEKSDYQRQLKNEKIQHS